MWELEEFIKIVAESLVEVFQVYKIKILRKYFQ